MTCEWSIQAPAPITIVFTELQTITSEAVVIITDGDTPLPAFGGQRDGRSLPPSFTSQAARITVKFASQPSKSTTRRPLSGFELELYALVPGGTRAPTASPTAAGDVPGLPIYALVRTQTHTQTRTNAHKRAHA